MKQILSLSYQISMIFIWKLKIYILFELRFIFFLNGHIHKIVSTFPNAVKIDLENSNVVSILSIAVQIDFQIDNVDSTLSNFVNFNVDVHNVAPKLNWRCATSRRHIDLKTSLK